jgi:hypothetical protein
VAYRRPRPTLKAFIKMLTTYGRGRAEQFRLHPTLGSALNFVPPGFVLYLLLLPLIAKLGWLQMSARGWGWYPLVGYGGSLLGQTVANLFRAGLARALCAAPLLFATHLFYGIGFWRGIFGNISRTKAATTEVAIEETAA